MPISCILIGQDNLLIQCGQLLLDRNHHIQAVISSQPMIQSWCAKNNLHCVPTLSALRAESKPSVDYLFSIVNGTILKADDLILAKKGAINYHDALLPKYAGVHATTWSILNNEPYHGITWHMITEGIDEGDVVYQSGFPVTKQDTALTLNLRCFDEATAGFSTLIEQIETNTLIAKKQTPQDRTYYGLTHPLPYLGFINWATQSATVIEAQCRALHFGQYPNRVGTLKLQLQDSYVIVLKAEVATQLNTNTKAFGTILAIEPQGLLISTINEPIFIKHVLTLDGKTLSANELAKAYSLSINDQLPLIDELELKDNISLYKAALKYEPFWVQQLQNTLEHTLYSDRIFKPGQPTSLEPIHYKRCEQNSHIAFASVLIYLYRINNHENLTVYLSHEESLLCASLLPFTTDLHSILTGKEVIDLLTNQFEFIQKKTPFLKDTYLRHPILKGLSTVGLVTVGWGDSPIPEQSLLHFSLDTVNGLCIHHRVDPDFQGGAFCKVIEHLTSHISNLFHTLVNDPTQLIHDIVFLTKAEQNTLFTWGSGEYIPYPSHTIYTLFERNAKQATDKRAIIDENGITTYQQLKEKVDSYIALIESNAISSRICVTSMTDACASAIAVLTTGSLLSIYMTRDEKKALFFTPNSLMTQKHIINRGHWFAKHSKLSTESIFHTTADDPHVFPDWLTTFLIGCTLCFINHPDVTHIRLAPEELSCLLIDPLRVKAMKSLQYLLLTQSLKHTQATAALWRLLNPSSQFIVIKPMDTSKLQPNTHEVPQYASCI